MHCSLNGQEDAERRTLARSRGKIDRSAMLAHDGLDSRESHTASSFGTDERLKDLRLNLRVDTAT